MFSAGAEGIVKAAATETGRVVAKIATPPQHGCAVFFFFFSFSVTGFLSLFGIVFASVAVEAVCPGLENSSVGIQAVLEKFLSLTVPGISSVVLPSIRLL